MVVLVIMGPRNMAKVVRTGGGGEVTQKYGGVYWLPGNVEQWWGTQVYGKGGRGKTLR